MTSVRHRTFIGVFYPESAPEAYRDIISGWAVPALLVLHDRDEGKKPHYHVMLMFTSMHSLAQVRGMMQELGSEVVQPAYDTRGAARYLVHLDHADKYQYALEAVEAFSGASVPDLLAPIGDPSPEILAFVRDQGIIEYAALVDYCLDQRQDWYRWASGHSIFLCAYLRSCRHGERITE